MFQCSLYVLLCNDKTLQAIWMKPHLVLSDFGWSTYFEVSLSLFSHCLVQNILCQTQLLPLLLLPTYIIIQYIIHLNIFFLTRGQKLWWVIWSWKRYTRTLCPHSVLIKELYEQYETTPMKNWKASNHHLSDWFIDWFR